MWKTQNYKMTLCDNYTKGYCQFGDICKFAHGEHELKKKDCRYGIDCKLRQNCKMSHTSIHYEFWEFLEQKAQSINVEPPPKYNEFDDLPAPPSFLLEEELPEILPPPPQFLFDEKPKKKPKFVVKPKSIKQQLLDIEKKQMNDYPQTKFNYFKDIADKIDDGIDYSKWTRDKRFYKCVLFKLNCCGNFQKLNYGFAGLNGCLAFPPGHYEKIKNCCSE